MERSEVLRALSLCMMEDTENFCKCDDCPMMEHACDYAFLEMVTIPRALLEEIRLQLDPVKSEWEHIAYVRTVPKCVQ